MLGQCPDRPEFMKHVGPVLHDIGVLFVWFTQHPTMAFFGGLVGIGLILMAVARVGVVKRTPVLKPPPKRRGRK